MTKRFHKFVKSPIGTLTLIAENDGLVAILWEKERPDRVKTGATELDDNHPILQETEKQLCEYFDGLRKQFDLPLKMYGTNFQTKVWTALQQIPFGETRSYGELAKSIGRPNASRAVGASNGRNPLSIVVPCHRVIGSSGKLTGFAGGLMAKEHLLKLENQSV